MTENRDATPLETAQNRAEPRERADAEVDLVNAVRGGDLRASLQALAETLAWDLTHCRADKAAPVATALQRALERLASLPAADGQGVIDELGARREQRERAAAADGGAAAEGSASAVRDLLDGR